MLKKYKKLIIATLNKIKSNIILLKLIKYDKVK